MEYLDGEASGGGESIPHMRATQVGWLLDSASPQVAGRTKWSILDSSPETSTIWWMHKEECGEARDNGSGAPYLRNRIHV